MNVPVEQAIGQFQSAFGYQPQYLAIAPGRVNLIGDHTDYSGGLAMPCAINLYTVAVAAMRAGECTTSRMVSDQPGCEPLILETIAPGPDAHSNGVLTSSWGNYLRGVQAGFAARGIATPVLDVAFTSTLPVGAGLSSSAALELCHASLLELASGHSLEPHDKALLCQHAEQEFAGVPCGILDQFAISFATKGCAMVLDCRSETVEQTPIPTGISLLILDSRVSHDLADGEYAHRRKEVAVAEEQLATSLRDASIDDVTAIHDKTLRKRARHVISENARVSEFASALSRADWKSAGQIMQHSHRSLCQDFEVSCPELDWLATEAVRAGAYGARMTGGGFGGSIVCLAPRECLSGIQTMASTTYRETFGHAAVVREVNAVGGAHARHLEVQA